jgi:hypothetical protein
MEKGPKKIQVRGNSRLANYTVTSGTSCFRHPAGRPFFPQATHRASNLSLPFRVPNSDSALIRPNPAKSGYKNKIFNVLPANRTCPHPILPKSTHPSSDRAVAPGRTKSNQKNGSDTTLRACDRNPNMKNYQTNPFCDAGLSCHYNGLRTKCTKPEGKTNPFRLGSVTLKRSNFFAASHRCAKLCVAL